MREFKFRAWIKELNRMANSVVTIYYDPPKPSILVDVSHPDYELFEGSFDDIILMQYTGLNDKKGVEIYEGDIVNLLNKYGRIISLKNVVELADFLGGHYYQTHMGGSTIYEVIGNIYDNPELLDDSK